MKQVAARMVVADDILSWGGNVPNDGEEVYRLSSSNRSIDWMDLNFKIYEPVKSWFHLLQTNSHGLSRVLLSFTVSKQPVKGIFSRDSDQPAGIRNLELQHITLW